MTDIPREIQIGALRYTVDENQAVAEAGDFWGLITHSEQTITLHPDQARDHQAVTVLHEVLHAHWRLLWLDAMDGDEERIVTSLAPLLLDTLRRNPGLVAYLMATE